MIIPETWEGFLIIGPLDKFNQTIRFPSRPHKFKREGSTFTLIHPFIKSSGEHVVIKANPEYQNPTIDTLVQGKAKGGMVLVTHPLFLELTKVHYIDATKGCPR